MTEGQTISFVFVRAGRNVRGFVARFDGKLVGYENVCRHLPLSLDGGDGEIFSRDGRHFFCQSHGALYEPATGLCVRGPCEGARLKKLKFAVHDGVIWLEQNSPETK